jgi:hypothetical protein
MKPFLSTLFLASLALCGCKTSQPVAPTVATNAPVTHTSALPDSLTPGKLVIVTTNTFPPGGWDAWRASHAAPTNLSPYMMLVWSNPQASSSWPVNNGFFLNAIQQTQDFVNWSNISPYFLACQQQCMFWVMHSNAQSLYRLVTVHGANPQQTYALPTYLDPGLQNPDTPCCQLDWLLSTNSVRLVLQ